VRKKEGRGKLRFNDSRMSEKKKNGQGKTTSHILHTLEKNKKESNSNSIPMEKSGNSREKKAERVTAH